MEFLKAFQKVKTVLYCVGAVVLICLIWFLIDFQRTTDYVAENYIVVSGTKSSTGKQAFVYEYTTYTGDNTLADIVGVNTQTIIGMNGITGGQAFTFDEDNDLRGIVKAVASSWVLQGVNIKGANKVDSIAKEAYDKLSNTSMDVKSLSNTLTDTYGFGQEKEHNLYLTASNTYYISTLLGTEAISSCRCCCCLTECVVEYLTSTAYKGEYAYVGPKGLHCGAVGLNEKERSAYLKDDGETSKTTVRTSNKITVGGKTAVIGEGLIDVSLTETVDSLVKRGKIQVGTVIMIISNEYKYNGVNAHPSHIEIVTYIDDNYIYTAGAGSSCNIMLDAILGYNFKIPRTETLHGASDLTGVKTTVGNILHWTESSIVKEVK